MELDIASILRRKKKTQAWLADAVGVSRPHISDIAAGKKKPSYDLLARIVEALDAPLSQLIDNEPHAEVTTDATERSGFSEDTALFLNKSTNNAAKSLARALAPKARQPELWATSADLPGFTLAKNDQLVVDLSVKPRSGDLVLTNTVNMKSGKSKTDIMRQYHDAFLDGHGTASIHESNDDITISPLGVVCAIFRPLQGS